MKRQQQRTVFELHVTYIQLSWPFGHVFFENLSPALLSFAFRAFLSKVGKTIFD